MQAMEEAIPDSILLKSENFMKNSWKETLAGDETLQLKVTDNCGRTPKRRTLVSRRPEYSISVRKLMWDMRSCIARILKLLGKRTAACCKIKHREEAIETAPSL